MLPNASLWIYAASPSPPGAVWDDVYEGWRVDFEDADEMFEYVLAFDRKPSTRLQMIVREEQERRCAT